MTRQQRLVTCLNEQFSPSHLEVVDESHLHAGHAGARPEGETHYRVIITSSQFAGISRVAIHRAIYAAAQAELDAGLHALAIEARSADAASVS